MNRLIYLTAAATLALSAGCEAPPANQPLDQSKIISVRPAYPDGAKAFVAEQRKLQEQREREQQKKPLFGNWFQKKPSQPANYESPTAAPPPKASSGRSFSDIFNPAKWGKSNQQTTANPPQQIQQGPQSSWQLPAENQSPPGQAQRAYEQMPPPNIIAPTSQPG
jgi:hypothetical protein